MGRAVGRLGVAMLALHDLGPSLIEAPAWSEMRSEMGAHVCSHPCGESEGSVQCKERDLGAAGGVPAATAHICDM